MMNKKSSFSLRWICLSLLFSLLLVGCAPQHPKDPDDPLENYNRHAFRFNQKVDKGVLKPVATVYSRAIPYTVRDSIGNVFSNLNEVPDMANDLMQGNFHYFGTDFWRFTVNSTIGVLGLFDVASNMGLEKHPQDFGLTLAKWGYKNSNYLVLPIFGPSTVRDTIALPVNWYMSPFRYVVKVNRRTRIQLRVLSLLNTRADLLSVDNVIEQASVDPYAFERDAYLQYRNNIIEQQDAEDIAHTKPPEELKTSGSAGAALTQS